MPRTRTVPVRAFRWKGSSHGAQTHDGRQLEDEQHHRRGRGADAGDLQPVRQGDLGRGVDIVICPPYVDLKPAKTVLDFDKTKIAVGARTCTGSRRAPTRGRSRCR
ncbi:MAG: hypothetical protein ACLTMP_02825 [Eggerthella lenta]